MTEQQELRSAFALPTKSDENYWIDWALGKWIKGNNDSVREAYRQCCPDSKQAIVQSLLKTLKIAADDPKQPTGLPLTEMSLYIFIATEDPVLESCGITDATELKRQIQLFRNFTENQRQEFLTHGEPRVLIPFLQRVITEAGKIRDAQCGLLGSGPAPKME